MFFIPAPLIALATFPGVIVHEIAHQLLCRLTDTAVFDVRYFQVANPSGYVLHERPSTPTKHLLISIAPFFINSILGAIIAAPAAISVLTFDQPDLLDVVLIWLGVSIAMHAFPSTGDARSLWGALKQEGTPFLFKALAAPIVLIIFLGAVLSVIWVDLLYGIGVATVLPKLLVNWLA